MYIKDGKSLFLSCRVMFRFIPTLCSLEANWRFSKSGKLLHCKTMTIPLISYNGAKSFHKKKILLLKFRQILFLKYRQTHFGSSLNWENCSSQKTMKIHSFHTMAQRRQVFSQKGNVHCSCKSCD